MALILDGTTGIGIDGGTQPLDPASLNAVVQTIIPTGTKMMFVQTVAPTGWTKDTTHDNKALRVVSGTASTGGTVAFTTAFASQAVNGSIANTTATNIAATQGGTVGSTTLSTAQIASHSHTHLVYHDYGYATSAPNRTTGMLNGGGGSANLGGNAAGGGGSHDHSFSGSSHNHTQNAHNHTFTGTAIDMAVQYVDVIIATKD
jgi:hypothetical protein